MRRRRIYKEECARAAIGRDGGTAMPVFFPSAASTFAATIHVEAEARKSEERAEVERR